MDWAARPPFHLTLSRPSRLARYFGGEGVAQPGQQHEHCDGVGARLGASGWRSRVQVLGTLSQARISCTEVPSRCRRLGPPVVWHSFEGVVQWQVRSVGWRRYKRCSLATVRPYLIRGSSMERLLDHECSTCLTVAGLVIAKVLLPIPRETLPVTSC